MAPLILKLLIVSFNEVKTRERNFIVLVGLLLCVLFLSEMIERFALTLRGVNTAKEYNFYTESNFKMNVQDHALPLLDTK